MAARWSERLPGSMRAVRSVRPAIPSSGAVAVEVDLALAPGTVPAQVTNRIAYSVPEGTPSAVLLDATKGEVDGPKVAVNRHPRS